MLVLASGSPQRKAILEQLGIAFRVEVPDVEELAEGDPDTVAAENARRKAFAVAGDHVLGADTIVELDGTVYGKPADEAHAAEMLQALAGRTHTVHTGVCVRRGGSAAESIARTRVTFRQPDDALLRWYLASGEWHGRAGGYAVQGRGAALVERIEGDYLNVVGLPVAPLLGLLGAISGR